MAAAAPRRVLVCPQEFKGSLRAEEAAGLETVVVPQVEIAVL